MKTTVVRMNHLVQKVDLKRWINHWLVNKIDLQVFLLEVHYEPLIILLILNVFLLYFPLLAWLESLLAINYY